MKKTLAMTAALLGALGLLAAEKTIPFRTAADFKPAGIENADAETLKLTKAQSYVCSKIFPIDPAKKYIVTGDFKMEKGTPCKVLLTVCQYTAGGSRIYGGFIYAVNGTDTELAAPVQKGDDAVTVKDSANWGDATKGGIYRVAFATDPSQSDLPNLRLSPRLGAFTPQAGETKIPVKGKIMRDYPAGTKVRMHRDVWGGSEIVVKTDTEWTSVERVIGPAQKLPAKQIFAYTWWPRAAQASVAISILPPKSFPADGVLLIRDLKLEQAE